MDCLHSGLVYSSTYTLYWFPSPICPLAIAMIILFDVLLRLHEVIRKVVACCNTPIPQTDLLFSSPLWTLADDVHSTGVHKEVGVGAVKMLRWLFHFPIPILWINNLQASTPSIFLGEPETSKSAEKKRRKVFCQFIDCLICWDLCLITAFGGKEFLTM